MTLAFGCVRQGDRCAHSSSAVSVESTDGHGSAVARDALDALVKSSPSRFAILIFAGLILVFTLLFSLPIARAGERSSTPLARCPVHGGLRRSA